MEDMETHGVVTPPPDTARPADYSIVVPVHNESAILPLTVPALLQATGPDAAEIVYVCNGCTDASANLIRTLAGPKAQVVEIAEASKTAALNAGDRRARAFPRFYVDADVTLPPGAFATLTNRLRTDDLQLVSPRLAFDMTQASPMSRAVARTWLGLPHAGTTAFHNVLGLSAAGRARWAEFPAILGDDIFISAQIPPASRRIVPEVCALTAPPATFWGWVRVRSRWLQGERQLAALNVTVQRHAGQKGALARMLLRANTFTGTCLFIMVRILAEAVSRSDVTGKSEWYTDRR